MAKFVALGSGIFRKRGRLFRKIDVDKGNLPIFLEKYLLGRL